MDDNPTTPTVMSPHFEQLDNPGAYHVHLQQKDYEVGNLNASANLATATLVANDEEYLPAAVEMDPDAKPSPNQQAALKSSVYRDGKRWLALVVLVLAVVLAVSQRRSHRFDHDKQRAEVMQAHIEQTFVVPQELFEPDAYEQAMDWILRRDMLLLAPTHPLLAQRFVAAYLYFATTSVYGDWRDCLSQPDGCDGSRWLSDSSECDWMGLHCNAQGEIFRLILRNRRLTGNIPAGLSQWSRLESVLLNDNELTGDLPASKFEGLPVLKSLALEYNQIVGNIADIAQLYRTLKSFDVRSNLLSGSVPESIGEATDLQYLRLSGNRLVGTLPPSIGRMTALTHLALGDNMLEGTLPDKLFQCTNLEALELLQNRFSGTVPSAIKNLSELQALDLRSNNFTGSLPEEIGALWRVTFLDISANPFVGPMPRGICVPNDIRSVPFIKANCVTNLSNGKTDKGVSCPCCTSCCNSEGAICS